MFALSLLLGVSCSVLSFSQAGGDNFVEGSENDKQVLKNVTAIPSDGLQSEGMENSTVLPTSLHSTSLDTSPAMRIFFPVLGGFVDFKPNIPILPGIFSFPSATPTFPTSFDKNIYPTDLNYITEYETYGQEPWELSGLFQGDIVLSRSQEMAHAFPQLPQLWTLPIPVFINGSEFVGGERDVITHAMREIEEKTCVRFRQYQDNDESFLIIRSHSKGCWSMVGRQDGGQVLHLQKPHCLKPGVVIHIFLHALGLYHQHSYPNRDQFLNIRCHNIKKGSKHNFKKYGNPTSPIRLLSFPYDYDSVMHYSSTAFSRNGQPTFIPKKPGVVTGHKTEMSLLDIEKIRYLYNCST